MTKQQNNTSRKRNPNKAKNICARLRVQAAKLQRAKGRPPSMSMSTPDPFRITEGAIVAAAQSGLLDREPSVRHVVLRHIKSKRSSCNLLDAAWKTLSKKYEWRIPNELTEAYLVEDGGSADSGVAHELNFGRAAWVAETLAWCIERDLGENWTENDTSTGEGSPGTEWSDWLMIKEIAARLHVGGDNPRARDVISALSKINGELHSDPKNRLRHRVRIDKMSKNCRSKFSSTISS